MNGAVQQLAIVASTLTAALQTELETLSHGISVMIGITNDLLDAEALRRGRLRIAAGPTDLRAVLSECAPSASAGVPCVLSVAPDVPAEIIVDALRLRQARAASGHAHSAIACFPLPPAPRQSSSRALGCASIRIFSIAAPRVCCGIDLSTRTALD
jgi:hypothetical protein